MEKHAGLEGIYFIDPPQLVDHCLFKYRPDGMVKDGDLAVFMDKNGNFTQQVIRHGGFF